MTNSFRFQVFGTALHRADSVVWPVVPFPLERRAHQCLIRPWCDDEETDTIEFEVLAQIHANVINVGVRQRRWEILEDSPLLRR